MSFRFNPQGLLAILFVVVLCTGLTAVVGFSHVGNTLTKKLRSETPATLAVQQLLASLEAQQRALIQALNAADSVPDWDSLQTALNTFEADLGEARRAAADDVEQLALEPVKTAWEAHRNRAESLLADRSGPKAPITPAACGELLLSCWNMERQLAGLVRLNWTSLAATEDEIHTGTRRYADWIAVLTTAGVLLALCLNHRISTLMIQPIRRINRFIDRAVLGELHMRLSLQEGDLLNDLARSCNRIVEDLQQVTEESRRRILTERELAEALIESFDAPTAAVDTGGDLLLANAGARVLLTGPKGNEVVARLRDALRENSGGFEHNGVRYALETVAVPNAETFAGKLIRLHAQ